MIELRAHHLLCSLTFSGRGYTPDFERDFINVIARMQNDEPIMIVSGPDMICASVQGCDGSHCHEARIEKRDRLALEDISNLLGVTLKVGSIIAPSTLFTETFRQQYQQRAVRRACFDCQWSSLCGDIAENAFKSTLLLGN